MNTALDSESDPSLPSAAAAEAMTRATPVAVADGDPVKPNPTVAYALLGRLLEMAQRYRVEGSARQATELFWTLAEDHPDTPQAETAKQELMAMAEDYGRRNNQHMARSIYERLLALED